MDFRNGNGQVRICQPCKRNSDLQDDLGQSFIKYSCVKHKSYTFRNQALIKRLAKKSTGYYKGVYNNIALIFASSAMYPLLAIFMFWKIGESEVVLDINPYDAIDTSAAALAAIDKVFVFLELIVLLLLCGLFKRYYKRFVRNI